MKLRCSCGQLEGRLASPERAGRAVCYCRDCRAFARFLGEPERILDNHGGSDIVATTPRFVSFTRGGEQMRCMSLSPRGLLRWYTACCRTPIGNTPRDPKISYVGLLHNGFEAAAVDVDAVFGPARAKINTNSAEGDVASTPMAALRSMAKIARSLLASRLSGKYRDNPFFKPGTAEPVVTPQVLTLPQREALERWH